MQEESKEILRWALRERQKNTWPRCDYKELIELTIVMLGGTLDGFSIKFPGPDHHARWMIKALYILKIHLLLNVFIITEEERRKVILLSEFIHIFYIKHWFESSLTTAAPRSDLTFIAKIMKYRLKQTLLAWTECQKTLVVHDPPACDSFSCGQKS